MAYTGQPIPSTVVNIAQVKISDGKSIDVTIPANTAAVAGNFYVVAGFFGLVMQNVKADENTAGTTVALQIAQAEYITSQIDTANTFAKGALLYFDPTKNVFSDTSAKGLILVGRVSSAKDASNVIQFIRYPQVNAAATA